MKRALAVALGVLVLVTLAAAPAEAGRTQASTASITSVTPIFVTSGRDDCGDYCEYKAAVTLTWNGTSRLWVSQLLDGVRRAPGELRLTGSGTNVTVIVSGIRVEPGTGPLVAELFVLSKRSWSLAASKASAPITCTAVSV